MANEKRLIDASAWKSFYEDKKNILDRFYTHDAGYEDALDNVDDWMDAQPTVDVAEMKWIPVSERLPETDNENTHAFDVLVYIPQREGCSQYGIYIGKLKTVPANDGSGNFWGIPIEECEWTVWGWSYFNHPVVTHWMPLPHPPKGE